MLIIMFCFTCDEREIWSTIKRSQSIMNMAVGSKFQLQKTILIFQPETEKMNIKMKYQFSA